ncbi:MAG: extracellular solute-binding protein [Anaerolineaceae bacterium]|nr:extracellular solute-binding protein [Anaerolineaceae bacterium]
MKIKSLTLLTILFLVVFTLGLAGCKPAETSVEPVAPVAPVEPSAPAAPAEPTTPVEPAIPTEPVAPAEVKDLVSWFQYDQNNEDPASDERVGNAYLRKTIPEFNADFAGKWNWVNIPKAWDKMSSELVAAVIAGGDVPDLIEVGASSLPTFYNNGAVQDLSVWAKGQSWYSDLEPGALKACTGPDGGLYCIPVSTRPHVVYVWADHYPNGFPTTPEQFMIEAERLKAEGVYAWTYFGSTAYSGNGAQRMVWNLISSFGGTYDDGKGNMLLNTSENIAAITFLRETVLKGYNPDTVFAGGFVEEDSFKDSTAAAIPTGLFGYRYINPLTAPDGTKYETGSAEDMIDAIADGKVVMRPMFAPSGKTPGCNTDAITFAVPTGAKNIESAYDYINWIMGDIGRHVEYVLGPGAGFPALKSAQSAPEMQTPFYQQAAVAVNSSICVNASGSLQRPVEANELIMNAVYKLIKEDLTLDIAAELQKAQDEYNANN